LSGYAPYREVALQRMRQGLILEHLSLVGHVIHRLPPGLRRANTEEDLFSAGTLGLVEAANKFDPARGVPFTAFARIRVHGAILDEIRRNCPLPQEMLEKSVRVRKLVEEAAPGMSLEEIAAGAGIEFDEFLNCLEALRILKPGALPGTPEQETIRDHRENDPSSRMESGERVAELGKAIDQLEPTARRVVILYYFEDLKLREIGELLGLSESRISRILSAAIAQLRLEMTLV